MLLTMPRLYVSSYVSLFLLLTLPNFSAARTKNYVSKDIFQSKHFIENKGQFNQLAQHIDRIDFALHNGTDEAYLNATSLQFHMLEQKRIVKEHLKHGQKEEREEIDLVKEDWFSLNWVGGNKKAMFITKDKTSHYYSYGTADLISYGYKSITYKSVYPGIDIRYDIHPKGGIEYSLIVASYKDLEKVQFKYSANHDLLVSVKKNRIMIRNSTGQLVESGIKAFYKDGSPINIEYQEENGLVRFKPVQKIDKDRSFVIDPWITVTTALTGTSPASHGFDVDYDVLGNLLVMGGGGGNNSTTTAPKVAKYDATGALVWVFAGYVTPASWNTSPIASQMGNFVVDKFSNKVYVSQPYVSSGSRAIRLTSGGIYDNFVSPAIPQLQEIWEMKFNCNTGDIIACGGTTNSNLNFGLIDSTTATVTPQNVTGQTGGFQDIVCADLDDNGELYAIFASSANNFVNNRIYKLDQNYTSSLWDVPSGFTTLIELANRPNSGYTHYSNGINCLSVRLPFLL